jgi:hypothetical protein
VIKGLGKWRLRSGVAFLPLALLAFVACVRAPAPSDTTHSATLSAQAIEDTPQTFVGNDACRECHAEISKTHQGSRHDRTLHLLKEQSLGEQAPPTGPIPQTGFSWEALGTSFSFGNAEASKESRKALDLAFGSGKTGMAFAAVVDKTRLAEARMSWFPLGKQWYETPGQQILPKNVPGNISEGEPARQCVGCHTITLPTDTVLPEKKFLGVGCEACHGAGNRHVVAMKAGVMARLYMDRLGTLDGNSVNELCGRCHRTEKDVMIKDLDRNKTDLFQAYGLAQSKCFQKGQLSCVRCHSPHTDVNTQEPRYDAVCLTCHNTQKAQNSTEKSIKICPVNPSNKCVSCHMPKRYEPVFPGSPRHVADHFIRVHLPNEKPLPKPINSNHLGMH